jgi:hypothetical protein
MAMFVLFGVIVMNTAAFAGSGEVITTPPPMKPNKSGLRLTVDTQWVDASGYRDVRLHLATATGAPSPDDRRLEIELSPNAYGNAGDFVTRQTIELPQGNTQSTTHMFVPQNFPWREITIRVFEEGSFWKELSSDSNVSNVGDEWSEAVPSFLVIDADAPTTTERTVLLHRFDVNPATFPETKKLVDIRGLEAVVKRGAFYAHVEGSQPSDVDLLRRLNSTARLEMMPPAGLPENWLGFTCFDFVVVSYDDLQLLAGEHPPAWSALTSWLTAGGNLIVYDLGTRYERLSPLESLLKLTPATSDGQYVSAGWQPARSRDFNDNTTRTFQSMQSYGSSYYPSEETEEAINTPVTTPIGSAFGEGTHDKFLTREAGLGLVVAMATANPYPGGSTEWSWLLNTVSARRYMWYLRHGLSLRRENNDVWDLLVPRTGMAPVWEFCVLITLFALVIGPVNYFVLLRQKRLYLLLATIPLGALVVTTGLFLYAIVSDGLGTRVRVRSYTHLDQTAGRAASWSRQSYYAGLAPSRGLSFPTNAAVYLSEQEPRLEHSDGLARQRQFVWDEKQRLRSGYMVSRVTSQFVVVHSAPTSAALRLDQVIAPTEAQNGLGGKIVQLLLRDRAGDYFWAENVAASEPCRFQPIKLENARSELKKQFLAHRPATPPGLDANQLIGWNRRWYGGWGIDNGQPEPRTASSLMEQQLRRLQNVKDDTLAPGSYVAILHSLPEIPLGIAGAREEASFHVVEGKF